MPKEDNIELPLLKVLNDAGGSLSIRDAIAKTKDFYPELTDEEKASMLVSGKNRLNNRIAWCRQKLVEKGEIDASTRGTWKITEKGKRRVESEWSSWTPVYVEIELPLKRTKNSKNKKTKESIIKSDYTIPQESIDSAIKEIEENTKKELLYRLKKLDSSTFEKIVGDLFKKMGFEIVDVTGKSHDKGIDIISIFNIGSGKTLVQAKKWNNSNVGIDEVQRLSGVVQNHRANTGVLVTTADFTADAKREAERAGNIRLINGEELVNLMIRYELGIRKVPVYYSKIDEDYFAEL